MEANMHDGLKALAVAQQALKAGDAEKALRFAAKAARLYPSTQTESFLASLRAGSSNGHAPSDSTTANGSDSTGPTASEPSGMGTSGLHRRGPRPSSQSAPRRSPPSTASSSDHSSATPEQRALVTSILSKSCYYEILGVSRTASDDEIKRSYRKLALKLHPDKNRAHKADDAFKAVSKAFTCLSDPTKRQQYDAYGAEEPSMGLGRGGFGGGDGMGRRATGNPFFDDEIDPEEIFRMFFGGNPFMSGATRVYSFGGQQGRRQAQYAQQQQHQPSTGEANLFRALFSLLPFFLLILFNIVSQSSSPPFSLSQSRNYPAATATAAHGVPFFVPSAAEFESKYALGSRERMRLELQVESDWREAMQRNCYNEQMLRQRYQFYGQRQKAEQMKMPSCDELARKFGGGGTKTDSGSSSTGGGATAA